MCNLYSLVKGQAAIRELAEVMADHTGNLPAMAGIYPDYPAPIVRNQECGREMVMARWGMPSPAFALEDAERRPVRLADLRGVDFSEANLEDAAVR